MVLIRPDNLLSVAVIFYMMQYIKLIQCVIILLIFVTPGRVVILVL